MRWGVFILFFATLFINAFSAFGQTNKLKLIGKPRFLENEIVARRDINGRYCAGIVIISDRDGFRYDSNMGIVGVTDMPGKDIVYLSPDEQVLEIYLTGFEPLHLILHNIGIVLKPKQMWQIRLQAEQKTSLDSLPVAIISRPAYEEITIDGKLKGRGPVHYLIPGVHILKIEMSGYQTLVDTINVKPGQLNFEYTLKKQELAPVNITSTPSGATVYLDGSLLGTTLIEKFVPVGRYVLRVEKTGYQPIEETFVVSKPRVTKSFVLEKALAYLQIDTYEYARVFVNGKRVMPNQRISLVPSIVQVKIDVAGVDSLSQNLLLKMGKLSRIEFFPKFPAGDLRVMVVKPSTASIYLYDTRKNLIKTAQNALTLNHLPANRPLLLKVSASRYKDYKETIFLLPGQVTERSITLELPVDYMPPTSSAQKPVKKEEHSRAWKPIIFAPPFLLNTSTELHQWFFNPAGFVNDFYISSGGILEQYNASSTSSWGSFSLNYKVDNALYYGHVNIGSQRFGFSISYAKKILKTVETGLQLRDGWRPLQSYRSLDEVFSPTLSFGTMFGFRIAVRANFHNFTYRWSSVSEFKLSKRITTFDVGVQQNFADVLYIGYYGNQFRKYVNSRKEDTQNQPLSRELNGKLNLGHLWLSGGIRWIRRGAVEDTLVYYQAALNLGEHIWINGFFAKSPSFMIYNFVNDNITKMNQFGGSIYFDFGGLIIGYQYKKMKFARSIKNPFLNERGTGPVEAHLVDQNHVLHTITLNIVI